MKKKILIIIFVLTFVLISGCNYNIQKNGLPKKIKIGTIRVANDKTVADKLNIFKNIFSKKGIDVELIFFDSGTSANIAFSSSAIDFAEMGYTNSVVALSRGIDVELIWIHDVLGENEALVAQKGRNINNIKDLRGKKIATPFASTSHLSLVKALELNGISKHDVTLLDMNTVDIVAAWKRGDIDAAYSWEPTLSDLKKTGNVLITSKDLAKKGITTVNIDLVNKNFSKKYPELVYDYILALSKAGSIYKTNPEKAIKAAAESLRITELEAKSQMNGSMWLTRRELLSNDYFGTSKKPGNFVNVFYDTGRFLHDERKIKKVPSIEEIKKFINPIYIERSLEME